jgi:hypothetical protein
MLGRLDGVRFAGPGADDTGRPAATVTIATGHLRYELLFDPDRAALLETRQVLVTPEARTGTRRRRRPFGTGPAGMS